MYKVKDHIKRVKIKVKSTSGKESIHICEIRGLTQSPGVYKVVVNIEPEEGYGHIYNINDNKLKVMPNLIDPRIEPIIEDNSEILELEPVDN